VVHKNLDVLAELIGKRRGASSAVTGTYSRMTFVCYARFMATDACEAEPCNAASFLPAEPQPSSEALTLSLSTYPIVNLLFKSSPRRPSNKTKQNRIAKVAEQYEEYDNGSS
jgi:hypothetical protein